MMPMFTNIGRIRDALIPSVLIVLESSSINLIAMNAAFDGCIGSGQGQRSPLASIDVVEVKMLRSSSQTNPHSLPTL
jgi:hypothetical protein